MIHIAAAEDDAAFRTQLKTYLEQYMKDSGEEADLTLFEDGSELFPYKAERFDVVFLDIEMPGMNGIETARKIRETDAYVIIVFITNMAKYALKGYEVQAFDYVLKPLKYPAFARKLDKVIRRAKAQKTEHFVTISQGADLLRIKTSDIYYIEVMKHNVTYHTADGDITIRSSMKETEEAFAGLPFEKCGKSFLVNLEHVTGLKDGMVQVGGESLLLSRTRKQAFTEALVAYKSNQ